MDEKVQNVDSTEDDILSTVTGAASDLLTGTTIPSPIRKNFFKAFDQLCTAAIDIPVAHMEGIAAEKRALTQSRLKIISTSGDQIAKQMEVDPEFASIAGQKYSQKIIREQVNLDAIGAAAAHQLKDDAKAFGSNALIVEAYIPAQVEANPADKQISDAWLNHFEQEARNTSTAEMQLLFGRILAGEVQKPSSFSIKTVRLLSSLDSDIAQMFRRFCSLSISLQSGAKLLDVRVLMAAGNGGWNELDSFGLGFEELNILQEYGLIIAEYDSKYDYTSCLTHRDEPVSAPLIYQKRQWGLRDPSEPRNYTGISLTGISLSTSGKELFKVVDLEAADSDILKLHMHALKSYLENQGLEMIPSPSVF